MIITRESNRIRTVKVRTMASIVPIPLFDLFCWISVVESVGVSSDCVTSSVVSDVGTDAKENELDQIASNNNSLT